MPDYDHLITITLLGEVTSGKTGLLYRVSQNNLPAPHDLIIGQNNFVNFYDHIPNKKIKAILCDTGEQIKRDSFQARAHGFILVYDITNAKTFAAIRKWKDQATELNRGAATTVLVATKMDLSEKRQVTTEAGQKLATELGIPFFEVSAKTGKNVDQVFQTAITLAYNAIYKESDQKREKDQTTIAVKPVEVVAPRPNYGIRKTRYEIFKENEEWLKQREKRLEYVQQALTQPPLSGPEKFVLLDELSKLGQQDLQKLGEHLRKQGLKEADKPTSEGDDLNSITPSSSHS